MEIKLKNGRSIGENHPAYILAEIGINHNGEIEVAKKLIDIAARIGIDGVKFQKRNIDLMYTKDFLAQPYIKEGSFGETYGKHKLFLEFTDDQLVDLKHYTEERGVDFIVSGFDVEGFDFINDKLDVLFHKVPSPLVNHTPLLKHIAGYKKPIVLSTGMHTYEEVKNAVEIILQQNDQLIVLQCTTSYPTDYKDVNLSVMTRYRRDFNVLTGYSSHDRGVVVSAASVLMGGCFIEKHFTLDRTMKGPDHVSSVEPRGLELIKSYTRVLEAAVGAERKELIDAEIKARDKYGYSCVAKANIVSGTILTEDLVTYKVPGYGIKPKDIERFLGKPVKRNIGQDEIISENDFQ